MRPWDGEVRQEQRAARSAVEKRETGHGGLSSLDSDRAEEENWSGARFELRIKGQKAEESKVAAPLTTLQGKVGVSGLEGCRKSNNNNRLPASCRPGEAQAK
jgi:hypothetical protein